VTPHALLAARRAELAASIHATPRAHEHSDAFVARMLGPTLCTEVGRPPLALPSDPTATTYRGFPVLAATGFALGAGAVATNEVIAGFVSGIQRLEGRSDGGLTAFVADDVALLGVADGLAHLADDGRATQARAWLLRVIDQARGSDQWTGRLRALAGDLLDGRGRLRVLPDDTGVDARALELALRRAWPEVFRSTPMLGEDGRAALLRNLLIDAPPHMGDPERAAVWLVALDVLIDAACASLSPTVSDVARILSRVQHALKRWRWVDKSRRRETMPSRWLIDDEYDVQALLWTVLHPIHGAALVDETYLPDWGNVQPRADLGITTLKLMIEVKLARQPADFAKIEEQVAGDLGLYFKETDRFDRMLVFVYDDCDRSHAEKYDSLKNALLARERIEDVIIVRRPSMLPDRRMRG
jgi:hypothetical protein